MDSAGLHLLLDQGLPREAAERLRAVGVPCTHVGEIGMVAATDTEIIEWARERGYAVATLDADFHAILAVGHASKPSVIRIRLEGQDGEAVANLLRQSLAKYAGELGQGCLITVKQRKTTCHLLSSAD